MFVRVLYSSPQSDSLMKRSFYKLLDLLPNFVHKRPLTAEYDFAGVVANANGSTWSCGDQIFGWITPGMSKFAFPSPLIPQSNLWTDFDRPELKDERGCSLRIYRRTRGEYYPPPIEYYTDAGFWNLADWHDSLSGHLPRRQSERY